MVLEKKRENHKHHCGELKEEHGSVWSCNEKSKDVSMYSKRNVNGRSQINDVTLLYSLNHPVSRRIFKISKGFREGQQQ